MWKKPTDDAVTNGPTSIVADDASLERKKPTERAVIGSAIVFKGSVEGSQDLLVEGEVEGTIELRSNTVTIGKSGRVRANVYGKTIIVEGDVRGDIFGADQVIVQRSGNVRGNITAPRVTLEDGAKLKGSIDMDPQAAESAKKLEQAERTSATAPKPNGAMHASN